MAKALTAAGIARYKPSKQRREIRDGAATGLYLILQESGQRSFALRFRKPNGKPAKLTLGPVDVSGVEPATAPSLGSLGAPLTLAGARSFALRFRKPNGKPAKLTLGPVDVSGVEPATAPSLDSLGAPLTLAGARQLAAEIHRQRAMGRDIVADMKATKHQRRVAIREGAANTFAAAVVEFVEHHAKPKTRRWRISARMLGLRYAPDGSGPTLIKGGLAERWSDRPVTKIHPHDPGQQPEREPGSKAHIADAGQTQGGIICVRMPSALG